MMSTFTEESIQQLDQNEQGETAFYVTQHNDRLQLEALLLVKEELVTKPISFITNTL